MISASITGLRRRAVAVVATSLAVVLAFAMAPRAVADPLPGYDLDPVVLEQRMEDCVTGVVPDSYLLMAWINLRTGEPRRWHCWSLKHMLVRADGGEEHDPFKDVAGLMICADRTVSYGFPRRGDPGNVRYTYQYVGTQRMANVVVNEATGDIVTIYTSPADDWTTCAQWSP